MAVLVASAVLLPEQALAQHALTSDEPLPPEAEGCNLCHGPHGAGTRSDHILRQGDLPVLAAGAPGLGAVSASCLRCHTTPSVRATQPEFADGAPGLAGGAYLQFDLADDHPVGRIDPSSILEEPGAASSPFVGSRRGEASVLDVGGAFELRCTACHDPHDPAGALPSLEDERLLCSSCHDAGRYAYGRHADLGCSSCHALHAGHSGKLLRRANVDDVCTRCHSSGGQVPSVSSFDELANRRAQLYGVTVSSVAPSGHATLPDGRCVDCHPMHE